MNGWAVIPFELVRSWARGSFSSTNLREQLDGKLAAVNESEADRFRHVSGGRRQNTFEELKSGDTALWDVNGKPLLTEYLVTPIEVVRGWTNTARIVVDVDVIGIIDNVMSR